MKLPPTPPPPRACVSCFEGETTTAIAVRGEAEYLVAFLMSLDIEQEDATAIIRDVAARDYGCTEGMFPGGDMVKAFVVCPDCAKKSNRNFVPKTPVRRADGALNIPLLDQPEESRKKPDLLPPDGRHRAS